jgi:cell division protein FtsI/penicillin-binding protein 2
VGPVVRTRFRWLAAGVTLFAAGIVLRLAFVQIVRADWLRARAEGQRWREIEVPAMRGAILDREGRELAVSLHTESLFAHPWRVHEPERMAHLLAPEIGVDEAKLLSDLRSNKSFDYLHRFLEPEQVEAVRRLNLPIGDNKPLGFLPSSKRYYPHGNLAVHVLGFANIDGVGVDGVEHQLDSELRGEPLRYLVLRDGQNGCLKRTVVGGAPHPPHDVMLTLDLVLQHTVERELDEAIRTTGAHAASGLLLDPATGQILALANRPTVDANQYGRARPEERVDRAVVRQYEPGSTFKIVTMATALELGKVRPEQRFDCENGAWVYYDRRIRDSSPHGVMTAAEILEKSSNIGMAKIIRPVDPTALHDAIARFGFGRKTGIELPGELSGLLPPVATWSGQSQPSLAFGHEIDVTALQMISAAATIANDGVRVPPRLVLGTTAAAGFVPAPTPEPERVVSSATAHTLTSMLEGVVVRGTGKNAQLAGYRLAGKTGTAQKIVDRRYSETEFMASFVGFGPVSAPRLVCLIVLDTPRGDYHLGGQVAAPVVGRVLEQALRYLRVPYDDDLPEDPRASDLAARRARMKVPPTAMPRAIVGPDGIPDLRGSSLREAVTALARRGCRPRVAGAGVVVEQDPPPGTPIVGARSCGLRLGDPRELEPKPEPEPVLRAALTRKKTKRAPR